MSDLQQISQFLIPAAQQYATATGDSKPINAIIARFGEAAQIRDIQDFFFGDWRPQQDPAMLQAQQQAAAIESQKTMAQTEEIKAKTVARLVDAQYKQGGAAAPAQQKMQWNDLFNRQKVRMQEEAHLQKMVHLQEQQDIQAAAAEQAAKNRGK
jgi:hypothetical protein